MGSVNFAPFETMAPGNVSMTRFEPTFAGKLGGTSIQLLEF